MDLDALKAHLTSLGDTPLLRATDTVLPPQLTDLLATFPDGVCQGTPGSQAPRIDTGHTALTLGLVCASTEWPAGERVTLAVTGMTVTVAADGSAGIVLSGAFDTVDVVCTVTEGEDGALTAAVRPRRQGAFADSLDELGERLGSTSVWQSARQGLSALDLAARDVAGFDFRLSPKDGVVPTVRAVTSMAVVAALDLRALSLEIAVWLPDLRVTGRLRDGEPLGVRALLESFGLPVSEVPATPAVTELSFTASLGRSFLVRMRATGDWGIGPFALTTLSVALYYDPARTFVAQIGGTVSIGHSIDIDVSASQTGSAKGGWTFSGGLAAGAIGVGEVIDALRLPDVPGPFRSLELTALRLSHTTGTKIFDFLCRGRIPIADGITATLALTVTRNDSAVHYGGRLAIGDFSFDVVFDEERTGTELLVAVFHSTADGAPVTFRDLVAHFSADLAADVPDSLRIELTDAKFVRVKPASGPAVFCVGVDLSASVDLAGLPLVGGFLAEAGGELAVDNLQVLYSSGVFDTTATGAANPLLAQARVVELPTGGLKAGPAALADLRIGQERTPVALGLPTGPAGPAGPAAPGNSAQAAPDTPAVPSSAPASPGTPASSGVWFDVQKQLGVIQINRIGVMYQHNALLFGLDAGVRLGPLTMELDGLAVGSSLDRFAPVFHLDGLGIGYVSPPIEIEGALLHLPDDRLDEGVAFQFDGTATIAVPDFSLAAVGSYAQLTTGQPSLFVFAQLEAPIVAAPPILVTGLMAGFGFNRELTLPSPREVSGFPLLVLNKQGPDADRRPSAVLDVLEGRRPAVPGGPPREWIAPRQGSYWLALGVEFTVAEVVNSKVLLAAEFGRETALAVLGIATLQLPMPAESATRTYVYAELGLEAVVRPLSGSFELAAQLAPVSYVLTPACHLTGGFAASVWFGDHPNAGQFVVTLGGYHPSFRRPTGYPDVPRLGIDWAVSDNLTITAQAYLAVTPSCAMAGGRLSIVFHAGDFRAWFTAQADVLLSWRPFFFTARVSVSIGASYQVNIGILHKTISVTVGADLELWGPPTGGSVTAHFLTFSRTIGFGPGPSGADTEALGWDGFADLLPKPADVVTIAPVNGVDKAMRNTDDADDADDSDDPADATGELSNSGEVWYARARDLRFFTQSAVPASHLRLGDAPLSPPGPEDGPAVDIRPMDRTGLVGEHRLKLFYEGTPAAMDGWTATARTHHLPAALWGAPPAPFSHTPDAPGAEVLPDRPVGYDLRAPRPELAESRGVFPLSEYSADEIPPGLAPLPPSSVPDRDHLCVPDDSSVDRIGRIDRGTARTGRDQLCAALADAGLFSGPADPLAGLAAGAAHLYSRAPLTRNPSQD
ncbi:DUF6603 domain-containing protein [Streptomyces qinzhouensis]|uniref:DUF6603 domain-containing protein n=1 Tax=Streptomyces qinzhouensis TaxID=2599401 RepID=A0A5B8JJN4_9ACTN|nr:DUF6603 domain-containing protein [Streptomyces qinzhouensis]QDY80051.1 hypothetical protein FQU76_29935 [Streptomyces qinzhouensis]